MTIRTGNGARNSSVAQENLKNSLVGRQLRVKIEHDDTSSSPPKSVAHDETLQRPSSDQNSTLIPSDKPKVVHIDPARLARFKKKSAQKSSKEDSNSSELWKLARQVFGVFSKLSRTKKEKKPKLPDEDRFNSLSKTGALNNPNNLRFCTYEQYIAAHTQSRLLPVIPAEESNIPSDEELNISNEEESGYMVPVSSLSSEDQQELVRNQESIYEEISEQYDGDDWPKYIAPKPPNKSILRLSGMINGYPIKSWKLPPEPNTTIGESCSHAFVSLAEEINPQSIQ